MYEELEHCPFCGRKHEHMKKYGPSSRCMHWEFVCDLCGAIAMSEKALALFQQDSKLRMRLINLFVEKAIKNRLQLNIMSNAICAGEVKDIMLGKMILVVADDEDLRGETSYPRYTVTQILQNYPATVIDKLNRAIGNIGRLQSLPDSCILDEPHVSINQAHLFAESEIEINYFADMLNQAGWCERKISNIDMRIPILLTVDGWRKFDELAKDWQNSNTAFVAMWFDNITEAYREAVKDAIKDSGYDEPVFIDAYEHNNFIMDEVINQINEARFVIADFTCIPEQSEKNGKIPGGVRGGVYFEAGYARGLGKDVIVTCRDSPDAKKRRNFDIDQLNTLFWHQDGDNLFDSNNNDFSKRLAERIKATVGRGKKQI